MSFSFEILHTSTIRDCLQYSENSTSVAILAFETKKTNKSNQLVDQLSPTVC